MLQRKDSTQLDVNINKVDGPPNKGQGLPMKVRGSKVY